MSRGVRDFSDDFVVDDAARECCWERGAGRLLRRRSSGPAPLPAAQVVPHLPSAPLPWTAAHRQLAAAPYPAASRRRAPGGLPPGAPPPTAEREEDPHRLAQRQKQVGVRRSQGGATLCRR